MNSYRTLLMMMIYWSKLSTSPVEKNSYVPSTCKHAVPSQHGSIASRHPCVFVRTFELNVRSYKSFAYWYKWLLHIPYIYNCQTGVLLIYAAKNPHLEENKTVNRAKSMLPVSLLGIVRTFVETPDIGWLQQHWFFWEFLFLFICNCLICDVQAHLLAQCIPMPPRRHRVGFVVQFRHAPALHAGLREEACLVGRTACAAKRVRSNIAID